MESLSQTEWNSEFEKLMRNRLIMGAMRYGSLGGAGKGQHDRLSAIIEKAKAYRETGNDELLVDIANYALVEFVEGYHPMKHFAATDDQGHAKVKW